MLYELAIELNVLMEQGATAMPSVRKVPEAIDAPRLVSECTTSAILRTSSARKRGLILDGGLGAFGDHDVGLDVGHAGQHLDQPHTVNGTARARDSNDDPLRNPSSRSWRHPTCPASRPQFVITLPGSRPVNRWAPVRPHRWRSRGEPSRERPAAAGR